MKNYRDYEQFGISRYMYELSESLIPALQQVFSDIDEIANRRQLKVLKAFQNSYLCEAELHGSSGYGYNDSGREKLEEAFAEALEAEAAFLRFQFASGSQVLYQMLRALLRSGDELIVATGTVYDSLQPGMRALSDQGITLKYIDLKLGDHTGSLCQRAELDLETIVRSLSPSTKAVYVQKSRGYSLRPSLLSEDIKILRETLDAAGFTVPILVDNCYGEFVEKHEPTYYGADLIAGSLIKNPGGGIAPSGGYIAGKKELVELVAEQITAPGIGREIGPSLGFSRDLGLGLYLAPQIVANALKTGAHLSALFTELGYNVEPLASGRRGDIVQIIELGESSKLEAFAKAIQLAAPIDHHFTPIPSEMPGYDCDIIMASGSFTQGSSIELSADGPLRPPFTAFFQGSFNFPAGRLAALLAGDAVRAVGGQ
ncbi:MAG: methionine gamma-lyase family protein [Eubacteriales bacterium]|nr:methionine gamma-lyase family protein [Eubacteriales bacterium]